jgi:hypothetical protein
VPDVLHHCEFLGEIECVAHGGSVGENIVWTFNRIRVCPVVVSHHLVPGIPRFRGLS